MACFLAPTTAAIITSGMRKKIPAKYHLEWLNTMFWGGVVMLAVEHIAHGEVVFFPPFLTAMKSPADINIMLKEIAIVGGGITLAIVAAWGVVVAVANAVASIRAKKARVVAV